MWRELWSRALLTCAIGACSILGDFGLRYGKSESARALFDNATHATVGGLTWTLIVVLSRKSVVRNLKSILSCFLLASFIDLDHFIAARSWHIHDATHLPKRPFLHCTTVPIVLWILFISLSYTFHSLLLEHISWVMLAAFLSHHIRDGTRRGLWFCPFGSTCPIPYYLYATDVEELALYFYIACGIGTAALIVLFVLVIMLLVKVNRLAEDGQTNMMADFCYTNPTIVPGELLSRRGFSMYSGADNFEDEFGKNKSIPYGTYHEARSKF
ncbi:transmembrane protein 267-like isoform X2 [Cardiocondyla obscurior]|uniref:transmembrane protein 267-like isoform X2 n=1 Tax=Cardiocondyla obscurior TaxID=286306 RepID=UPI003965840B